MSRGDEKHSMEQNSLLMMLKMKSSYCSTAIWKVTSGELLTKEAMRNTFYSIQKNLHT
jgi:hypothetical protein